jgi:integrase
MSSERIPFDSAAYIVKRAGRPSWYLETCVEGVQRRKSLKTNNKAIALERARVQYKQLHARPWGTAPVGAIPFSDAVEELTEHQQATGRAQRTVEIIKNASKIFGRWLNDELRFSRELLLSDVTPERLQKYFGWRLKQKVEQTGKSISPGTVNQDRRSLRAIFNRAIRIGSMPSPNPIVATDPIRETKRLKWIPSEEEVLRFLKEAKTPYLCVGPFGKTNGRTKERNPLFHDVAVLIANTGLRISEALALEWQDVNTTGGHCKGGTLYVRSKEENPIKDREERAIPLNDVVREMLLERRQLVEKECRWIYPNPDGNPHNARTFRRDHMAISKKAGLSKLTPQSLRRFYGTAQAQAGVPPFVLKVWMGHSSVTTTEAHYVGGGSGSWMPRAIGGAAMAD